METVVSVTEERARKTLLPLKGGQVKVTTMVRAAIKGTDLRWTTYEGRLNRVGTEDFEIEGRVTKARHLQPPYPEGKFLLRLEDVRELVHGDTVTIVKS